MPWVEAAGDGAELVDAAGVTWTVSGALAWGADGAPLPARLEVDGDTLVVRVNAEGAAYPVTADPVLSAATTTMTGSAVNDYLGWSASSAGDVNGDGYDDVIIGAPGYDSSSDSDVGAAQIQHGYAVADGDGVYVGGEITTPQDCDDTDATVGASAVAYMDADGDGFGSTTLVTTCSGSTGTAATATDCDDARADVNPAATDVPNDTVDQDCDGVDATFGPIGNGGTTNGNGCSTAPAAPLTWLATLLALPVLVLRRRR